MKALYKEEEIKNSRWTKFNQNINEQQALFKRLGINSESPICWVLYRNDDDEIAIDSSYWNPSYGFDDIENDRVLYITPVLQPSMPKRIIVEIKNDWIEMDTHRHVLKNLDVGYYWVDLAEHPSKVVLFFNGNDFYDGDKQVPCSLILKFKGIPDAE